MKQKAFSSSERIFFKQIIGQKEQDKKPLVLWGWKRDLVVNKIRQPESRTVYFSADLTPELGRAYFFLETRAKKSEIDSLKKIIGGNRLLKGYRLRVSHRPEKGRKYKDYARLRLEIGEPTVYDKKTVKRRLQGKPRLFIAPPKLIPVSQNYNISRYVPFTLCCGSGLSAESGLPLLGQIHNLFEVDNAKTGKLIFGVEDGLVNRLIKDVQHEFTKFCEFTIEAIKAKPSQSHQILARLYKKGLIKQIFTDNMDDLFQKLKLPYTQTRLSIFPDRFPVKFAKGVKALLVIGVAVDRRDVIKQARRQGLKIIVINPVMGVAPHSRNMDYMSQGDIFFKETASQALPKIIKASGF